MDAEEAPDKSSEIDELSPAAPEASERTVEHLRSTLGSGLNRRTFLAAAALGSAAATLVNRVGGSGGISFGPLTAFADDLSGLNCTANDVRIVGPGVVLNEPCNCTGTFNAQVQFRVINNTGTTRYCVTVHFCPGSNGFAPGDILIGDIPPKSDARYTVTIPNYPCGSGLVCFGACGPGTDPDTGLPDCSFPKGTPCPAGQCCTTISWDVNPGCPDRVIGSKCRHQQVCIQGRGITTVDCDTSTAGNQTNCSVTCGGSTTVRVCTTSNASFGPFTFTLGGQSFGPTSDTCHDFTVGPLTSTTTLTATVTDASGCARSAPVTLTVTPITASLAVSGDTGCNSGQLTFTASPTGTGNTFEFKKDGTTVQSGSSNTYTYNPTLAAGGGLDTGCHTITVNVTTGGGCTATATSHVTQCVNSTVASGACP